jgi:hypothetical protein
MWHSFLPEGNELKMMLAELDSMRALNTAFVTHAEKMCLGPSRRPGLAAIIMHLSYGAGCSI